MGRAEAMARLNGAVSASGRQSSVWLPSEYARSDIPQVDPPLARMLGRGGEIRVKLFLTMVMQATADPRTIKHFTNEHYAGMLGMYGAQGARRVRDARKWLENQGFTRTESRPRMQDQVTVLNAAGDRTEWPPRPPQYITIPIGFWTHGWILELSGRATALIVVLRDNATKQNAPVWIEGYRKRQYGLSPDTWTRATQELQSHGLLTTVRKLGGSSTASPRLRTLYDLDVAALGTPVQ